MNTKILLLASMVILSCNSKQSTDTTTSENNTTTKDTTASSTVQDVAASSAPKNNIPFVYGIDISKYQGDEIEFISSKNDTLTFVICKATEGLTGKDPDFNTNWNTIDQKGFIRGAYHFYHCGDDPVKQAAHFISVVQAFEAGDFPPIVDFEETSIDKGCTMAQIQSNLLTFLKQVQEKTGRRPLIYTDHNIGGKYLTNAAFKDYPLFIADYRKGNAPAALPGAWKDMPWTLWQKSESYVVHSTTDDFDIFNGSQEDLKAFLSRH
ncbi:MAG: GH25 family lysozyme [Chitinophagaceae bacterium]